MNIRGQQLKTSQESNIHHCSNLGSTVSGGFFLFKKQLIYFREFTYSLLGVEGKGCQIHFFFGLYLLS